MATGGDRKAVLTALVANLGIAVAKFAGFLLTRSSSMLAESVHSLADSSNQGLLLYGGARAQRAATTEHPFGYGRVRYFWSFVVAIVLFALGAVFSLYEGYHKLTHPEPLRSVGIALGILAIAMVLEGFALRTAVVEANHVRGTQGWWAFVRHAKSPELPVILLEDCGAMLGLVFAFIGVVLAAVTGEPAFDAYGTMAIGVLLAVISVILAVEMKSLLIGESASPGDVTAIRAAIERSDGIRRLIHLKTQHLGPDELLVAAKVELEPGLSVAGLVAAIDAAEAAVRVEVPSARVMYLEPDVEVAPAAQA